jgi:hypothetical protein
VVDTIATHVAAHLALPAGWHPSRSLISAFGDADASQVGAAVDLIRRAAARIEAYVFVGPCHAGAGPFPVPLHARTRATLGRLPRRGAQLTMPVGVRNEG